MTDTVLNHRGESVSPDLRMRTETKTNSQEIAHNSTGLINALRMHSSVGDQVGGITILGRSERRE